MMTTSASCSVRPQQLIEVMDFESRSRSASSTTRVKRSLLEKLKLGVQSSKFLCASNPRTLARSSRDHVVTMTTGHESMVTSDVITTVCPATKRQRIVTSEKVQRLRNDVTTDCYDVTATCCEHDSGSCRRHQCTASVIRDCVARGGVSHVMRRQLRRRRYTRVDVIHQTDELQWKESSTMGDMTSQCDRYPTVLPGNGGVLTSFEAQPRTPSDTTISKGPYYIYVYIYIYIYIYSDGNDLISIDLKSWFEITFCDLWFWFDINQKLIYRILCVISDW